MLRRAATTRSPIRCSRATSSSEPRSAPSALEEDDMDRHGDTDEDRGRRVHAPLSNAVLEPGIAKLEAEAGMRDEEEERHACRKERLDAAADRCRRSEGGQDRHRMSERERGGREPD